MNIIGLSISSLCLAVSHGCASAAKSRTMPTAGVSESDDVGDIHVGGEILKSAEQTRDIMLSDLNLFSDALYTSLTRISLALDTIEASVDC